MSLLIKFGNLLFRKRRLMFCGLIFCFILYSLHLRSLNNESLSSFSDSGSSNSLNRNKPNPMPVDVVVSDDNQSRTAAIVAYDDDPSDWSPSSEFGCVMPKVEYVGHNTSDKVKPCRVSFDWGELRDGTWRLVPDVRERLGSNSGQVTCTYRPVILIDDFKISHGAVVSLNDGQRVDHDVIEVSCSIDGASRRGRKRAFSKVYAQLLEKSEPEVENKLPVDSECKPLSVLLISYDSVSHVSWIKRLPKSYAYMRDIMKFDVFDGYNIVGDGTPGALIPILTGYTEEELPSVLKNDPQAKYVDEVYPFIWKDLHKLNYKSIYLDDWPHVGCFTYRMKGFLNHKTTYYFKHYQLRLWELVSRYYYSRNSLLDDFCMGAVKRHKAVIDLMHSFQRIYANKTATESSSKVFGFMHYVENSHDTNDRLGWIDEDLFGFLSDLYERHLLNNTAVFLYSDHGARFGDKFNSPQRYIEERKPFVSLYLPDAYKRANAAKYANLVANKNQLVSPFDMHATVRDLTCMQPIEYDAAKMRQFEENADPKRHRSLSLLSAISPQRTCEDIGISDHFCACIRPWRRVSVKRSEIVAASQFVVASINQLTEPVRDRCLKLTLKATQMAEKLINQNNRTIFKIELTTSPNDAIYEVLVHRHEVASYEFKSPEFSIKNRNDISRIDAYGEQPHCVADFNNNPSFILDLRKFCFCKKNKSPQRRRGRVF